MEVLFGMVWLPFTLFFVSSLCVPHCILMGFSSKSDKWEAGSDMYMFCFEYRG